jgi:hypothetical protein
MSREGDGDGVAAARDGGDLRRLGVNAPQARGVAALEKPVVREGERDRRSLAGEFLRAFVILAAIGYGRIL